MRELIPKENRFQAFFGVLRSLINEGAAGDDRQCYRILGAMATSGLLTLSWYSEPLGSSKWLALVRTAFLSIW